MSRRGGRKRKEDEALVISDDDNGERKEDKRSKVNGAAASSSSSAAAAAAASPARTQLAPTAAASSSSPSISAAASFRPLAELEDVVCSACHASFECADDSARLPRTLPCGHPMCSACIRQSLGLTPGSVLCPHEHGQLKISVSKGVAAAAVSTVEGWLRLLPPRADLIAAIKNQQTMMTRIGQHGARCSRSGCKSSVTHYCSKCLDLCTDHERSRHAALPSHKAATMPIAQKESFLRGQSQSEVSNAASAIRFRVGALLKQQQLQTERTEAELKKAQAQVQAKKRELQTNAQALNVLQHTMDQMRSADDDTVIEMNEELPPIAAAWTKHDSTVLNTLSLERVAALRTFLGPHRSLSNATLIYRASRDGFKATDWKRLCGGKSGLLTIVKVKGNGFVCGAFTPFQWSLDELTEGASISDRTGEAFLFSLVNDHDRAVKLRLKESEKANAGGLFLDCGPTFGNGDLGLMFNGKSADSPEGNWTDPTPFEFDCVADGGAPIAYDKTLLVGDDDDSDCVNFAAAEIECWQL